MQDVIEVIRVTKDPEMGIIDRTRKLIELRDIISIEESGQEVIRELESQGLVLITLTYTELIIEESYSTIKRKWKKFREEAKVADNKLSNMLN